MEDYLYGLTRILYSHEDITGLHRIWRTSLSMGTLGSRTRLDILEALSELVRKKMVAVLDVGDENITMRSVTPTKKTSDTYRT